MVKGAPYLKKTGEEMGGFLLRRQGKPRHIEILPPVFRKRLVELTGRWFVLQCLHDDVLERVSVAVKQDEEHSVFVEHAFIMRGDITTGQTRPLRFDQRRHPFGEL